MSLTTGEMTPADLAAVTGNNGNRGGFMNDGAWWIIILFLFAFMGNWGGGYTGNAGNSGAADNYVLASDFAQVERKIDGVYAGICDSTFALNNGINNGFAAAQNTMTQGFAGLNTAIGTQGYETRNAITQAQIADMQNFNALQAQLAQCCCDNRAATADLKYTVAQTGNDVSRQTERGFCDTNYAIASNTTAIVQNAHTDADRIIARIDAMENARQAERIAQLQSENQGLRLAASQAEQNNYLIGQLKQPCPIPAYTVPNPYCCNNGCGCA